MDEVRQLDRYGLANTLLWMRDRGPKGRTPLPLLDKTMDAHWKEWLESMGRSDNLPLHLRPAWLEFDYMRRRRRYRVGRILPVSGRVYIQRRRQAWNIKMVQSG